jgi:hypothetical protein
MSDRDETRNYWREPHINTILCVSPPESMVEAGTASNHYTTLTFGVFTE